MKAARSSAGNVRRELAEFDVAREAKQLVEEVALAAELPEFLTLVAYPRLPD